MFAGATKRPTSRRCRVTDGVRSLRMSAAAMMMMVVVVHRGTGAGATATTSLVRVLVTLQFLLRFLCFRHASLEMVNDGAQRHIELGFDARQARNVNQRLAILVGILVVVLADGLTNFVELTEQCFVELRVALRGLVHALELAFQFVVVDRSKHERMLQQLLACPSLIRILRKEKIKN